MTQNCTVCTSGKRQLHISLRKPTTSSTGTVFVAFCKLIKYHQRSSMPLKAFTTTSNAKYGAATSTLKWKLTLEKDSLCPSPFQHNHWLGHGKKQQMISTVASNESSFTHYKILSLQLIYHWCQIHTSICRRKHNASAALQTRWAWRSARRKQKFDPQHLKSATS